MTILTKTEIGARLNSGNSNQIFVDPILNKDSMGPMSLDLRLGYDFLVSVVNQNPSVRLHPKHDTSGPDAFFQSVRRDLGDVFLIHPSQTVLATTLEYIGLPSDVYGEIVGRNSYSRLGLYISSMFQPGFRGCVSLELFNHSNAPIELIVGSRIVQARFFRVEASESHTVGCQPKKYFCNIRPTISRASHDDDLDRLASRSTQRRR